MNTDELIRSLAGNVRPVPRNAVGLRLAAGMIAGGLVTFAAVALVLGVRPDLSGALHGYSFWIKAAYTLSLAVLGVGFLVRLARPGASVGRVRWLLGVPLALLAVIGGGELAHAPRSRRVAMWLGDTWRICPWLVLLLSLPIFVGLLWSFRRLAPTRLRAAGGTAGFAAGGCAATLYGLHCPEVSAIFVLTWYTLGICLAAAAGALVGPRFLRW